MPEGVERRVLRLGQEFLKDHHLTLSMSAVGHCGDNAPAEGVFGMLKCERVNRRRSLA